MLEIILLLILGLISWFKPVEDDSPEDEIEERRRH